MRAETFYVAVPEGEPLTDISEWDDSIEDAMSRGEDIVTDSCSGMPMAQIYEVTVKLIKESTVKIDWENV